MTETTPTLLVAHIRARLAKSTLDSPAINISKAGWSLVLVGLGMLTEPTHGEEDAQVTAALARFREILRTASGDMEEEDTEHGAMAYALAAADEVRLAQCATR